MSTLIWAKVAFASLDNHPNEISVPQNSSISDLLEKACNVFSVDDVNDYCLKYANSPITPTAHVNSLFLPPDIVLIFAKKDHFDSTADDTSAFNTQDFNDPLSESMYNTMTRMDNLVLDHVNQNQAVDANYQFTAVGQDATDTYAEVRENVKADPLMIKILVANEFNIAEAVSIKISLVRPSNRL